MLNIDLVEQAIEHGDYEAAKSICDKLIAEASDDEEVLQRLHSVHDIIRKHQQGQGPLAAAEGKLHGKEIEILDDWLGALDGFKHGPLSQ